MLCKKCGAQIRREDRRADGLYECPGCGAVYRAKAKSDAGNASDSQAGPKRAAKAKPAAGAKARRGKRGRALPVWGRPALGIAAAVAVLVIALGIGLAVRGGQRDATLSAALTAAPSAESTVQPAVTPTPEPTEPPIQPATVHFRAVGDVMSHKLQLTHAYQEDGSFDYGPQFEYVKDALSKADYTIANLELSIATGDNYSSYPRFRTPEAILASLRDCGVDMLTMANNHILDGFFDGLTHTVDKAEEYGFDHVGAYRSAEEAAQPTVVDINGIRFGFIAYTLDTNGNEKHITDEQASFCVKRIKQADFKADVQALRDAGAEVVICLPHWGEEGRRSVSGGCRTYAQEMVEAGVDIILGSHPHVVLPVDISEVEVDGEKKDVLVAWSMGNFISYMAAQYMDSGIILDFSVTRDENGKISIHDVGYVPVYVWGNKHVFHLICSGDFYQQRPDGMSDEDFQRMKQSVREITKMIGEDGIALLPN